MLKIGNKVFLNIQEAVGWLLANNALPFQCNVNYVANTEIAKTAIINPSPAEVKVGSLVLFADSKVGTVSGITANGFTVGSDYTDIANALAFITNVSVDGSGHLITTLSDGSTKDAGQIKMISSFSIDASQHLIAAYNDGSSVDVGALGDYSNAGFVAKTLSQTQANETFSFVYSGSASLEIVNVYNRLIVINSVLHLVFNVKVRNISGGSLTAYGFNTTCLLSANVGGKLYDINGNQVSDAVTPDVLVTGMNLYISSSISGKTHQAVVELFNSDSPNKVKVSVNFKKADGTAGIDLEDNESLVICGRLPLTLL